MMMKCDCIEMLDEEGNYRFVPDGVIDYTVMFHDCAYTRKRSKLALEAEAYAVAKVKILPKRTKPETVSKIFNDALSGKMSFLVAEAGLLQ